jgi:beta-glucosidase
LVSQIGEAIAEEYNKEKVVVRLGLGVNIKSSPLGGRKFKFFSEDSFLTDELWIAFVNGVQSKGVGTSVKHYAPNNQEPLLMSFQMKEHFRKFIFSHLSQF